MKRFLSELSERWSIVIALRTVMPYLFLVVFLPLGSLRLSAQNPDTKRNWHWYFGARAGLDFSNGAPVADTTGIMTVVQGNSTISDLDGNLLFYSDGKWAYDSQGDTMPNGFDLGVGAGATPWDGTVIIPKPTMDTIYYLFTVDGAEHGFQNGLRYHVVDMSANAGLGDVVEANVHLNTDVMSEEIAATRHGNGCDYWVVVHGWHTGAFLAYRVSEDGVDSIPVISTIGYDYGEMQLIDPFAGGYSMRFSPNGSMMAQAIDWGWVNNGISPEEGLYLFDNMTGTFTDFFIIPLDTTTNGPGAFSPNGQVLYLEYGGYLAKLYQYDVSVFDSASVVSSRNFVYQEGSNYGLGQDLKIGPDGRIFATNEGFGALNNIDSLGTIENPDVWGPGCDVRQFSVGLHGRLPLASLPNFVADFAAPLAPEHGCPTSMTEVFIGASIQVQWTGDELLLTPSQHFAGFDGHVQVFSSDGRLVLSTTMRFDGSMEELPLPGTASGVYLVTVDTVGLGAVFDKVVIN